MKNVSLNALVGLTTLAGLAVAQDAAFEVGEEEAAGLVKDGKAKEAPAVTEKPAGKASGPVKARVLADCSFGRANDVVTVSAAELAAGQQGGTLDGSKAAVAYAMTLDQNKPKTAE